MSAAVITVTLLATWSAGVARRVALTTTLSLALVSEPRLKLDWARAGAQSATKATEERSAAEEKEKDFIKRLLAQEARTAIAKRLSAPAARDSNLSPVRFTPLHPA